MAAPIEAAGGTFTGKGYIWKRFLVTRRRGNCNFFPARSHGMLGHCRGSSIVSHRSHSQPSLSQTFRGLLPGIALVVAACTLTGDDFEPVRVDALANLPPDAGAQSTPEACGAGAQCCASLPCAREQVCLDGECRPAPVTPADAGACPAGDCS